MKVIFMGDSGQLPDPSSKKGDTIDTPVKMSKAFSDLDKSVIDKVYRQKEGPLLKMLKKISSNNYFVKYKSKTNSDSLMFKKMNDYKEMLSSDLLNDPGNTIVLSAKNTGVLEANKMARAVLGNSGSPKVGEYLVGYGGKDNKQIEKGHVANSVKYEITDVKVSEIKRDGISLFPARIDLFSPKLAELMELGVSFEGDPHPKMSYYQLKNSDSLDFNLTEEQLEANNKYISSIFYEINEVVKRMNSYPKPRGSEMGSLISKKEELESMFKSIDLGEAYIYSPTQQRMIRFNKSNEQHTSWKNSHLVLKKGVDYGYAMTVHKSQGSTIKNVYLELDSIDGFPEKDVVSGKEKINSVKNSLYYVAASRASDKLVILDNIEFDEEIDLSEENKGTGVESSDLSGESKVVSNAYGVVTANNNPSESKTKSNIDLIAPQIAAQAYKENNSASANDMFMFGLRWTRKSKAKKPLNNKSYANKGMPTSSPLARDGYVYDTVDQKGSELPPLSDLQPIMQELEESLGIDMSNYDSVIGNIYLPGQRIATHRDTTESLSARNYPVVVYTIGNDSGITIYENTDNKGVATGKVSFGSDKKTNIPTKNGSMYTFGMDGKGRFELAHDTPKGIKRDKKFPPITLPNGKVVANYTITLTFRRAADLEPGMSDNPKKNTTQTEVSTQEKSVSANVEVVDRYSDADVKSNPDKIYVFGNNVNDTGKKGQAIIRDNENAFGIVTKMKPATDKSAYFYDTKLEANKKAIDIDIQEIKEDGRTVVFPKDGLGTGLAKLKEKAPKTYNHLKQRLLEEFGFNNDTGEVNSVNSDSTQEKDVSLQQDMIQGKDGESEQLDGGLEALKKSNPSLYAAILKKKGIDKSCGGN